MHKTVVQDDIVKTNARPFRVHIHFPYGLGVVAGLLEFALDGHRVCHVEGDAFVVADPPVLFLGLAGKEGNACRDAGGRGRIAPGKADATSRQLIQVWCLHKGVSIR